MAVFNAVYFCKEENTQDTQENTHVLHCFSQINCMKIYPPVPNLLSEGDKTLFEILA